VNAVRLFGRRVLEIGCGISLHAETMVMGLARIIRERADFGFYAV